MHAAGPPTSCRYQLHLASAIVVQAYLCLDARINTSGSILILTRLPIAAELEGFRQHRPLEAAHILACLGKMSDGWFASVPCRRHPSAMPCALPVMYQEANGVESGETPRMSTLLQRPRCDQSGTDNDKDYVKLLQPGQRTRSSKPVCGYTSDRNLKTMEGCGDEQDSTSETTSSCGCPMDFRDCLHYDDLSWRCCALNRFRTRLNLDNGDSTATVPYINDPTYLIFCLVATSAECSPLFLRIRHTFIQIVGREFHSMTAKCIRGLKPQLSPHSPSSSCVCTFMSSSVCTFNKNKLWFPRITAFEKKDQTTIRKLSMKLHTLLLEGGVKFEVYNLDPPSDFRQASGYPVASFYDSHHHKQHEILYIRIRAELNHFIDVVMINRDYVCVDKDVEHILFDWFCNDHDLFWSPATFDLWERLINHLNLLKTDCRSYNFADKISIRRRIRAQAEHRLC